MTQETLLQKWGRHYRRGGFFYAVYRGVKYVVFLVRRRFVKTRAS